MRIKDANFCIILIQPFGFWSKRDSLELWIIQVFFISVGIYVWCVQINLEKGKLIYFILKWKKIFTRWTLNTLELNCIKNVNYVLKEKVNFFIHVFAYEISNLILFQLIQLTYFLFFVLDIKKKSNLHQNQF